MAAAANFEEDEEWELRNEDGLFYKIKKRPRLDPTTTTSSSAPPPLPDPAAEEKIRRERKKRTLIKLRDKYQKEIDKWEHVSNTLKALQVKAQNQNQNQHHHHHQQQHRHELTTTMPSSCDLGVGLPNSSEPSGRRLLDNLLLRAEAEEGIIQDVSNLCDMAEAICNVEEERMKQSLCDLPVWASPRELMASLCDEKRESSR